MKQKADHHLEFLVNKNDRTANPLLPLLPTAHDNRPSSLSALATLPARPSPLRSASQLLNGGEEDAAGESDDGAGDADGDQSLRTEGESSALPKVKVEGQAIRKGSPSMLSRKLSIGTDLQWHP